MALIRISEAARRGFASRTTIYKAIRDGRITLKAGDQDEKLVDVADLVRLYGEPAGDAAQDQASGETPMVASLRRENEILLRELDAVRRNAREDRERGYERERELLDLLKASYRLLEHWPASRETASAIPDTVLPVSGIAAAAVAPINDFDFRKTRAEEAPAPATTSVEPVAKPQVAPAATAVEEEVQEPPKRESHLLRRAGRWLLRVALWLLLCSAALIGGAFLASKFLK